MSDPTAEQDATTREQAGDAPTTDTQGIATRVIRWTTAIVAMLGIVLVVNQQFYLRLFGITIFEISYIYYLMGVFLPLAFLLFPARKRGSTGLLVVLDVVLALAAAAIAAYFGFRGQDIVRHGWGALPPDHAVILGGLAWLLIIEAIRRTSGIPMMLIVVAFSIYPMVAHVMPGPLEAVPRDLTGTMAFHLLSTDSVLGIPMRVFVDILIGFIVFGVVLQATGGGKFFLDLAYSLLGRTRGGTGKVAVVSSSLFGSISGSAMSNVVTSGSMTIPAMRASGFRRETAAGLEVCASTGGVLMPPVMGAVAFVMAAMLGVPYPTIALAALLPSVLFYVGLFLQVDAYAATAGLEPVDKSELPSLLATLRQGWPYMLSLGLLLYILFVERRVGQAPFYASGLLLVFALLIPRMRAAAGSVVEVLFQVGKFLGQLVAIMAGVGTVMGSLVVTGVGATLSRELVGLAGGNIGPMLVLGAVSSLILGMGMTVTACYVFLAVVLAPGLVSLGFERISVHLFLIYWGMLSYLTPPIALAAYPAAAIADAKPIRTAVEAARMGGVIYVIPFFFILDPALIMQGPLTSTLLAFVLALVAVGAMAAGLGGYVVGIGHISLQSGWAATWALRGALFAGGVCIGVPTTAVRLTGIVLIVACLTILLVSKALAGRRPGGATPATASDELPG